MTVERMAARSEARVADPAGIRQAVDAAATEIAEQPWVLGIVAIGSYAAGTMGPGSDVDLIVLHRRPEPEGCRYLRERRRGVLLDLKYWTPEVAAGALCGTPAAQVVHRTGGVRVLLDRDGSAARLADRIRQAAQAAMPPVGPVERVQLDEGTRRALEGPIREAIEIGDATQAWFLLRGAAARIIEAAYRIAGLPYADFGKGLREVRRDLPDLAWRVDAALSDGDAENCRLALLALAGETLGDLAFQGDEFDTGWIPG